MKSNYLSWNRSECIEQLKLDFPDLRHRIEESECMSVFMTKLEELCQAVFANGSVEQHEAATRILLSLQMEGITLQERSSDKPIISNAFQILFNSLKYGHINATSDFYLDLYFLFRQLYSKELFLYTYSDLQQDMNRWPDGLDHSVLRVRRTRRHAILHHLLQHISNNPRQNSRYRFLSTDSEWNKLKKLVRWWNDHRFQLSMAARTPEEVNNLLEQSLSKSQMDILKDGYDQGIPIFITPYYASLLDVKGNHFDDSTIRSYVLYSRELINQFGHIKAWEKEDSIEQGKPNAAGWILPNHYNIHRRYPEVAILIPDSMGRACGGLCALCQRMYNFQKGVLNFDLEKLKPKALFQEKIRELMLYFEQDTQLRDILITGGDALMSQTKTLEIILEEIYQMAQRKRQANAIREDGDKYAELQRIRLGSRLPVYLPQRITPELKLLLRTFKKRAESIGIHQFIIQTHFESPLEITPESRNAIRAIQECGWLVDNQLVFTTQASRRGHTAKLRASLNRIGVITYYTFTVKGFAENRSLYAPNSRSIQEMKEEKQYGLLTPEITHSLEHIQHQGIIDATKLTTLLAEHHLPFLATDRNVLNLPGIGKSMTFETIGITTKGQRILRFTHDSTRNHSPVIAEFPEIIITENRSIASYLRQLDQHGEDIMHYNTIWNYHRGETEPRFNIYRYPAYDYHVTNRISHVAL